MTQILLDANLAGRLKASPSPLELCDPNGEIVGHFTPVKKAKIAIPFTEEEIRESKRMDTMAFLDMPSNQTEVKGIDFINWTNHYIRFPGKEQITGEEWYGARCGLLHTSRIVSRMSSKGTCRLIGYADQARLPVTYNPNHSTTLVMVSILALKDALFDGINRFLINVYSDKLKPTIVNPRIEEMVQHFPFERNGK